MDLYEKINLDQQPRDLSIGNMDYDAQLVSSLPTLFPRVRFLNLKHESGGGFHGVNTHVLKIVMVKNWENVQSIVNTSNIINVTMQLIQLLTFDHLTTLELGCEERNPTINQRQERTQILIGSIHNAPLLERLVLRYPLLKIEDVEKLHVGATRLKHLQFMEVYIYTEGEENHTTTYQRNESLETFSFRNTTKSLELIHHGRTVSDNQAICNAVRNWISYIGMMYSQLQTLDFILDSTWNGQNTMADKEVITTSLTTLLTNLKHLKNYAVDLCCDLQPILDVMRSNDVQLAHFGFLAENHLLSFEQISTTVQTAQPTVVSSISSLEINSAARTNSLNLGSPLIDLSRSLENLTILTVKCHSRNAPILLIDVLQNLTGLVSLEFEALKLDDVMDDGIFYSKVSIIPTGRLESMCLSEFVVQDGNDYMQRLNLLLAFILHSCPNLNNIKLNAKKISSEGKVNLDFRGNPRLQQITLDMPGCQYYTFHHEFGKHWRMIEEEIEEDDFRPRKFFVNLAWDTSNKDINLQLSEAAL